MAFLKRTWLARLGTGLNKFLIGDKGADGKQTLTNSPDTVVQEGDVISADNLNDLEDRIEDEFDEKADITALNDAIAGVKLTKVWENPAPSSTFSEQTVNITNLSSYEVLLIEYLTFSNSPRREIKIMRIKDSTNVTMQLEGTSMSITSSVSVVDIYNRLVSWQSSSADSLTFGNGRHAQIRTNGTIVVVDEYNNGVVPIVIYGVSDIYNS